LPEGIIPIILHPFEITPGSVHGAEGTTDDRPSSGTRIAGSRISLGRAEMKFKLAAAIVALGILLCLGVARATGWPYAETPPTPSVALRPVSAPPPDATPGPAPSTDHAVPVGGTTAACAVLLAAILLRRVARRR
jgi:hypothetical protein